MKTYMQEHRLRMILSAAAALALICGLAWKDEGISPLGWAAICAAIINVAWIVRPFTLGRVGSMAGALLTPLLSLCLLEFYTHVPWDLTVPIFILNAVFFYLTYLLLFFVTGRAQIAYPVATLIPMLAGVANYFVVMFRDVPIFPWDLLSLGTAATVTDNYTFTFSWRLVLVLIGFLTLIVLGSKNELRIRRLPIRGAAGAATAVLLCLSVWGVQKTEVGELFGLDTILFTPKVLYRNNGFVAAFLSNFRFLNIDEPKGYDPEIITAMEKEENTEADPADYPNIVVIMNEAFSDLAVWGEFGTDQDYMPYLHSLQEKVTNGNLFVSVKGGNTANTEFEFLTGDTMAFLPTGSVAYQQYISGETPALPGYLRSLGYATTAIHPYYASGWDRDEVYEYFGFDEFLDITDFQNPEKIRTYVSDRAAFDKIIECFERKEEDKPLFVFEVTMQNHGGYSREYPDFSAEITLTGQENSTSLQVESAERYLTLIKKTDEAFEELTNYFADYDEDTIIVMFGDHQPSDYITSVIARMTGVDTEESLEAFETGYQVPFVMWSNFDMDREYVERLSVNYLSAVLLEKAGIPTTGYQDYLLELKEQLPVICAGCHIDAEGNYYSNEEEDMYQGGLNTYQILQYNHLFDRKNRVSAFFGGTSAQ